MLSLPLFIGFAAGTKFVARTPLVDCFSFHSNEERATSSLTSFIASESPIALQNVLNNIGPGGEWALGVEAGLVVASPTKTDTTDCQWFFINLPTPVLFNCLKVFSPTLYGIVYR